MTIRWGDDVCGAERSSKLIVLQILKLLYKI